MIALYGKRAVFIDARIADGLIELVKETSDIRNFFNRRFHDQGVNWPRLVMFETWGKKRRGADNLHAHMLIVVPERITDRQIRGEMQKVFGVAKMMRQNVQIDITRPNWKQGQTYHGVTARGPLGKLLYVYERMGATHRDLDLNGGKRSRKAPLNRLRYNRHAKRLAQGMPSHFNSAIVHCDTGSKQAGEMAFAKWVKDEQRLVKLKIKHAARKTEVQKPPSPRQGQGGKATSIAI